MSSTQLVPKPKVLIFDLMGTCLDWHTSILSSLTDLVRSSEGSLANVEAVSSGLALDWRQGFFKEIQSRFEAGLSQEDIDVTHSRVLETLLVSRYGGRHRWDEVRFTNCIDAWHSQKAWPDVLVALPRLRKNFEVCVLANGTTRLQIDIIKSAGLSFDLLLSSELLGLTKPDPSMYWRAMKLLKRSPEDCIMIAAHAYDLRAAKRVGLRTVYIHRWTEDPRENMDAVRNENDVFIDGSANNDTCGLATLVEMLVV